MGYDPSFWDYGYYDIYAGIFTPYGYDDLTGYIPRYAGYLPRYAGGYPSRRRHALAASRARTADELSQMCGEDSREIAGLPVDQIQQAIQLTDVQRAALDDLANALATAAKNIKAACPTDISLSAPGRLAVMQLRVEAMIAAVATVQPPLQKFYDLLNDEQKARFTALGEDQRKYSTGSRFASSPTEGCAAAQHGVTDWPTAEIERRVHPTEAQRSSLVALQDAGAKAADMLKTFCQPDNALTPPARLAAVGQRLDPMLQAIKMVRSALEDFYGTLTDEQKAQFEAIGRERTGQRVDLFDRPRAPETHIRRRHVAGMEAPFGRADPRPRPDGAGVRIGGLTLARQSRAVGA